MDDVTIKHTTSDGRAVTLSVPRDLPVAIAMRAAALGVQIMETAIARRPMRVEPPTILVDYPEAARLLNISVAALKMRVSRGDVPGVVRTGRRVQFRRDRLQSIK